MRMAQCLIRAVAAANLMAPMLTRRVAQTAQTGAEIGHVRRAMSACALRALKQTHLWRNTMAWPLDLFDLGVQAGQLNMPGQPYHQSVMAFSTSLATRVRILSRSTLAARGLTIGTFDSISRARRWSLRSI